MSRGPTKGRLGLRWVHQRSVCRPLSSVGRSGREGRGVSKMMQEHFLTATPETCLPRIPRIKMLLRHHPPWSSSNTPGMSNHFSTAARRVSSMLRLQTSRTKSPSSSPSPLGTFAPAEGLAPRLLGAPHCRLKNALQSECKGGGLVARYPSATPSPASPPPPWHLRPCPRSRPEGSA